MAITIQEHNAKQIDEWIRERQGVAVWRSIDLSDPGAQVFTPVVDQLGKKTMRPGWRFANEPAEIIKSADAVTVIKPKEVRRFRIGLRIGAQGFKCKLTDASSEKVRKACEKYGEDSWYEFDYETQQAVIFVPGQKYSLEGYLKKEVHVG